MLLNKTDRARDALQAGSASGLGMLERRILIVTDGRRSLNEVMAMLGPDILPAIDRLIRGGYIDDGRARSPAAAAAVPATPGLGATFTGLVRAATEAVQARTEQIRANTAPVQAVAVSATPTAANHAQVTPVALPATRNGQRRSLVAAKMYVVDMLQLQRHPDAVDLKARLQTTSGQAELLEVILDGMRVLTQLTNESYGQRIVTRLREVLPEDMLPLLEQSIDPPRVSASTPHAAAPQLKVVGN